MNNEPDRQELRKQSLELHERLGQGKENICFKPNVLKKEIVVHSDWDDVAVKFEISWNKLEPIEWLKDAFEKAVKEFENSLFGDY